MTLRQCMLGCGFAAALTCGAAMAQPAAAALGTWRAPTTVIAGSPFPVSLQLTVEKVEADQRVTGRFIVLGSTAGPGQFHCPIAPVSGTFDGTALKVASPATNLCPERVFDGKLEGEQLTGKYKGPFPGWVELTFTRQR